MSAPSTTAQAVAALEAGLAALLSAPAALKPVNATAADLAEADKLGALVIAMARRAGEQRR